MLYYVETLPDIFDYPCISTYTCPPRAQMAATKAAMLQRSMCARLTRQLQGMGTAPCFTCHSRIASDSGMLEHILNPQHGAHTVWQNQQAMQLQQHTQDHPNLNQIKARHRSRIDREGHIALIDTCAIKGKSNICTNIDAIIKQIPHMQIWCKLILNEGPIRPTPHQTEFVQSRDVKVQDEAPVWRYRMKSMAYTYITLKPITEICS